MTKPTGTREDTLRWRVPQIFMNRARRASQSVWRTTPATHQPRDQGTTVCLCRWQTTTTAINQHETGTKEQQPLQVTLTWRSIKIIFGFRPLLQTLGEGRS